jgi:GT2 family glycosyltransferase
MAAPTISFVVPVRNDADRLRRCLRSIASAAPARLADSVEVVVADNGSTDDSADVARREGATVLNLADMRLGELRNRAAARARGNILAFVDADHEIDGQWMAAAVEMLSDAGTGAVGAPYRPPHPATWVQRFYDRLRRHPAHQEAVEWLGSGNMALRRAVFDEAGGFDTTLETCEDVDLCRKLRARGYGVLADERMRNVHHGDPRTLREVFFGELWRGRDNVRVSLRAPRSPRTIASAAVPMANLAAAGGCLAGVLSRSVPGLAIAALSLAFLASVVLVRAALMSRRVSDFPQAVAVATAYDAGRALALAGRFGHGQRRRAVPARGVA